MWRDDFSLRCLRDNFLAPYQQRYPDERVWNYVAMVDGVMGMGTEG